MQHLLEHCNNMTTMQQHRGEQMQTPTSAADKNINNKHNNMSTSSGPPVRSRQQAEQQPAGRAARAQPGRPRRGSTLKPWGRGTS